MSARQIGWLLRRWWWLVLAPAVVAAALVVAWAQQRTPLYTAEGSYVVRADVEDASDLVRATAALTDTDEIVSTYAGIARSSLIADRARERLDASGSAAEEVEVTSSVVPDANMVLIGARSRDPRLALDMAIAAGEMTEAYVSLGGGVFPMTVLDAASLPDAPTTRPVEWQVASGGLAGLAAGFGLAVAVGGSVPSAPPWRRPLRDIVDDQSSAHTKRYLQVRLHQELSRSRRAGQTFSVGVLQVEAAEPLTLTDAELAAVSTGIKGTLREQDILGHLGHGRFAAILPDVGLDDARTLVQRWRRSASSALLRERREREFMVSVAACQSEPWGFFGDPDAELIVSAL